MHACMHVMRWTLHCNSYASMVKHVERKIEKKVREVSGVAAMRGAGRKGLRAVVMRKNSQESR